MKQSDLLRAFQYVDDKYLDIVEQERHERTKGYRWKHWSAVAACILCLILLLTLPVVAVASNWFGLRDLLLPSGPGGEKDRINREQEFSGQEEERVIGLAGYQGSPEWQALAEWKLCLDAYDGGGTEFPGTGDRLDASFTRYSCYQVHSGELAEKMDEIAAKYDLKLHTTSYDMQKHPELLELCGDFLAEGKGSLYPAYMYEDGTFQTEGTVFLAEDEVWDFLLLRSVRGTFHDAMLDISDVADYEEWQYATACGVVVNLALGSDKALILADLEDCFVTVAVRSIVMPVYAGAAEGVTRETLEAMADSIDFTVLSPVTPPKAPEVSESVLPAPTVERDPEAVKMYAAILKNLLYSDILPDGTASGLQGGSSQFAVCDVDGDGKEELVLLYDPGVTAGMAGYVIGYDGESGATHIQLAEYPMFEFLANGGLKALDSHNQTYGEMWPYSLYRYLPESDSYEYVGHVHAADRKYLELEEHPEDYPAEADVSGAGTVYYVSEDGWGTVPIDEADYLAWLAANRGDSPALEISYLPLTEEAILSMEQ